MSDKIWINDFSILFEKNRITEFYPIKEQSQEEKINSIVRFSIYISLILSLYYNNLKFMFIFVFFLIFTFVIYRHHPELNPLHPKTLQKQVQDSATKQNSLASNSTTLNNFIPNLGVTNVIPPASGIINTTEDSGTFIRQGVIGKSESPYRQMQGSFIENLENPDNTNVDPGILQPLPDRSYPTDCTKPTIENPFMNFTMADYLNIDPTNNNIVDRVEACNPSDPTIKRDIDTDFNNNLFKDVDDVFGKGNSQRQFFTMPYTGMIPDQESFAKWLYLSPPTCHQDQENCLRSGIYEDLRSNRQIYYDPFNSVNNSSARASVPGNSISSAAKK